MEKQIKYRLALPADTDELVSLMNSQYARKKTPAYFQWQFFDPLWPTILMVAETEGKIIGMFGLQKKTLDNGTKIGQLIDLLIDSAYRGQGLFKGLADEAFQYFKDLEVFCVLPNLNGKNACEKSLGFRTIAKIDSIILAKDNFKNDFVIDSSLEHNDEQNLVSFNRNEEYRNWRFAKSPEYKYSRIALPESTFAITKIFKDPNTGEECGDIIEYECERNDPKTLAKLFIKTAEELFRNDIKNITTWALPHSGIYKILKKIGFTDSAQERYFCVKLLNDKHEYLNNINNWRLYQSDAEIY